MILACLTKKHRKNRPINDTGISTKKLLEIKMNNEIAHKTDEMLHQAVKSIDALLGEGYAKQNPELVSGFLIAASNNNIAESNKNI
jgi:hypothetical protein